MSEKYNQQKCQPCEGMAAAFSVEEAQEKMRELKIWELAEDGSLIFFSLKTKNFVAAVELIGKIAELAEEHNHHPDIHLTGYKNLKVVLRTHAVGGLTNNDFILAKEIERLLEK